MFTGSHSHTILTGSLTTCIAIMSAYWKGYNTETCRSPVTPCSQEVISDIMLTGSLTSCIAIMSYTGKFIIQKPVEI